MFARVCIVPDEDWRIYPGYPARSLSDAKNYTLHGHISGYK
jgi:hypothetical protein